MHIDLVVNKEDLDQTQDEWDYLYVLLDKYFELQEKEPDQILENFNGDQHSLFAYVRLDAEICNGGFIQLIYNGGGPFIFESPFIDTLEKWGVQNTVKLLRQVQTIYNETNISQQEDDTLDDFSDLYEENQQFDDLDDAYYNMKEDDAKLVKKYVEEHLDQFIKVQE